MSARNRRNLETSVQTPPFFLSMWRRPGRWTGRKWSGVSVNLSPVPCRRPCARGGWQGRRGVSAGARKQCMHGWWRAGARTTRCWRGCRLVTKQGGATGSSNGGMEGPRGLCSGAGRVGSSVGSVGDALLLWSGPHRRAAEVALLAPLGGARRSRECSAWATTGAAVWGQATLPPRPKYGAVGHNSVLTRGRPSWPTRSFLEMSAWDRAEPGPPTAQ